MRQLHPIGADFSLSDRQTHAASASHRKRPPKKRPFVALTAFGFEKFVSVFTGSHKQAFYLLVYGVP